MGRGRGHVLCAHGPDTSRGVNHMGLFVPTRPPRIRTEGGRGIARTIRGISACDSAAGSVACSSDPCQVGGRPMVAAPPPVALTLPGMRPRHVPSCSDGVVMPAANVLSTSLVRVQALCDTGGYARSQPAGRLGRGCTTRYTSTSASAPRLSGGRAEGRGPHLAQGARGKGGGGGGHVLMSHASRALHHADAGRGPPQTPQAPQRQVSKRGNGFQHACEPGTTEFEGGYGGWVRRRPAHSRSRIHDAEEKGPAAGTASGPRSQSLGRISLRLAGRRAKRRCIRNGCARAAGSVFSTATGTGDSSGRFVPFGRATRN